MFKKICCISDTHSSHRQLIIEPCDFIIHSGDILRKYKKENVEEFIDWFQSLPAKYKILVAGNHDRFIAREKELFIEMIDGKLIYLENSGIEIEGIRFWGSPSVKWCGPYKHFTYKEDKEEEAIFSMIPAGTDILITHSPPFGILDHENLPTVKPHHQGSKILLEQVLKIKPKLHVFGHIHRGHGIFKNNDTIFINAAIVNIEEDAFHQPILFNYSIKD